MNVLLAIIIMVLASSLLATIFRLQLGQDTSINTQLWPIITVMSLIVAILSSFYAKKQNEINSLLPKLTATEALSRALLGLSSVILSISLLFLINAIENDFTVIIFAFVAIAVIIYSIIMLWKKESQNKKGHKPLNPSN